MAPKKRKPSKKSKKKPRTRTTTRLITKGKNKGQRLVVKVYPNGNFYPVRTKGGGFKKA